MHNYLVCVLVVLLHSVVGPILFLLATIFFPGHPYIGSTTILPDKYSVRALARTKLRGEIYPLIVIGSLLCLIISFTIPLLTDSLGCGFLINKGGARRALKRGVRNQKGGVAPCYDAITRAMHSYGYVASSVQRFCISIACFTE